MAQDYIVRVVIFDVLYKIFKVKKILIKDLAY